VPLDLAIERPAGLTQGCLPQVFQDEPVGVADGYSAEREEAALVEPAALVEEEQVHVGRCYGGKTSTTLFASLRKSRRRACKT
jgi:hypothetical protein